VCGEKEAKPLPSVLYKLKKAVLYFAGVIVSVVILLGVMIYLGYVMNWHWKTHLQLKTSPRVCGGMF
jgi:hypothetical protein